jgi:hypothetical protein
VVGSGYPITNGTTNQISYEDFRESVIESNPNIFTTIQTIRVGSGNNQQQTTLEGHDLIMLTGSGVTPVGTEGFKVELFANDGTPGAKLYTFDNTEVGTNKFKTFLEVGTGYGDVTFTRPVSFNNALTVNNNLLVNGVLTARQVQTSIVTSSVQYESGSTRFGDTFEDTHEFTGSLKVSGSLALNTLTQNRVLLVGSNGTLTDSSAFTFNGTTLGVQAGITTTGYVNINGNGLKVDGVINNPLIGAVTQSLIDIAGGLQAYTASLKGQAIVSSSTQIQNYNLFAVTSSGNTFYGNQQITGSLNVSSGIVGSLLATNGVVSSSNQLFELNNQTGSQSSINTLTSAVTSSLLAQTASQAGVNTLISAVTTSLLAQTASQDGVNLGISIVTASLNAYTASGATSTSNINSFTASQIQFNLNTSASTGSLNAQTASQDSVNNLTLAVTSSLIGIVGGLQGYTASLKSVAIVSSSNQLFELNNQTGSQNSVNTLTSAVTSSLIGIVGGLQGYTASLKSVSIVSSSNQLFELNNQTGSQNSINNLTSAVTSSILTTIYDIQSYTASLKGAAIVSSSQQITNYNLFAQTSSASTKFYGDVTASGNISVGADSFTSPGGADKFIGVFSGQDSSIILQDSVETWEIYMNDDLYFTTGSTSPKNVMSLRRVTGNVEINEGNLVIGKAGKGIDFSITSNGSGTTTSELLNDYEEGTWTPTFAGTGGNTGQVYGSQDGTYTKVGRLVTFTANVSLTTLGTITGFVRIDGLPFTPQAVPGSRPATTHATGTTITTLPASDVYGGNAFMYLYKISQTNPTAATQLSQGDLTNTTNWQVNGFYYTA